MITDMLYAIKDLFKNWNNFDDNTDRPDYWYIVAFNWFVAIMFILVSFLLPHILSIFVKSNSQAINGRFIIFLFISFLMYSLYLLITLIPRIALTIRRYQDANINKYTSIITMIIPNILIIIGLWKTNILDNVLMLSIIIILEIINLVISTIPSK